MRPAAPATNTRRLRRHRPSPWAIASCKPRLLRSTGKNGKFRQARPLPYDWLVIAAGIRENHGAWFGDDIELARLTAKKIASGHVDPAGLPALRQKLAGFNGGTLVPTIPPAPYRCPPAPTSGR